MMRTRPGAVGAAEEEYIAREEADRQRDYDYLQEQQRQRAARLEEDARVEAQERAKQSHCMRCPQCSTPLRGDTLRGVPVDRCTTCGGVWTGTEQIAQLAAQPSGLLRSLAALFRGRSASS